MARTQLPADIEDVGTLVERLGGIPLHRIRLRPPLGKATEKDVLALLDRTNRLFELIDGVLVEKATGFRESVLAAWLAHLILSFLEQHDLGIVVGADGAMRFMPGLVRIPDVSFIRWEKLPGREPPPDPIPDLVPNLAVEVLSEGNTPGEMQRKLRHYFLSGVELVWIVDRWARTVDVYSVPDHHITLTEADVLDGGTVLPGLSLSVRHFFAKLPQNTAQGKVEKRTPRRGARRSRKEQ